MVDYFNRNPNPFIQIAQGSLDEATGTRIRQLVLTVLIGSATSIMPNLNSNSSNSINCSINQFPTILQIKHLSGTANHTQNHYYH